MPKTNHFPNSLHEAIRYFADKDMALTFLAALRWPKGVTCGTGGMAKNPALGRMERGRGGKPSRVRAAVARTLTQRGIRKRVMATVEKGSQLYSDPALQDTKGKLPKLYQHEAINHARE